jgi:hypothetical protein
MGKDASSVPYAGVMALFSNGRPAQHVLLPDLTLTKGKKGKQEATGYIEPRRCGHNTSSSS